MHSNKILILILNLTGLEYSMLGSSKKALGQPLTGATGTALGSRLTGRQMDLGCWIGVRSLGRKF